MLVAIAGHIDHGKTALVRALTGTDTDRLPEERERGISIDLGFAYWRPEGGGLIGLVDVPGHERFVRTMLAGLAGVDFAVLVVAADDGIMPQTVEHLQMLELMGIGRGLVAITKCDRVDALRVEEVARDVSDLLAGAGLAGWPAFPVSSLTGGGIAALAEALAAAARERVPLAPGAARFVIDRCFTVTGAGTVVTGTVLAGAISRDDQLVLSPPGMAVRVRGLQSNGAAIARAEAGERCALNIAGIEVGRVRRGDWLLAPSLHAPTRRIEARVRVLADHARPLRHGAAVRVHIGAAEVSARMLSRRQLAIGPGESGVVALALDEPVCAVNGARFVLRDGSGRALVGGGRIVDPFAPPRFRRDDGRDAIVAALERHDPAASLAALLACGNGEVDGTWFERSFGLPPGEAEPLCAGAGGPAVVRLCNRLIAADRVRATGESVLGLLARWHAERPEAGGVTPAELLRHLATPPSAGVLSANLRQLADAGSLCFAGPLVRLPGHTPSFGAAETAHWQALCDWLEDGPPRTVTLAEAAAELGCGEAAARAMLFRRRETGDLWAIDDCRFMLAGHVARLGASACLLARRHAEGFTAAQFRDATGIGRNHVIRLLEFFDRVGATARRGEIRVMREGHAAIVGGAEPWLAGQA